MQINTKLHCNLLRKLMGTTKKCVIVCRKNSLNLSKNSLMAHNNNYRISIKFNQRPFT